MNAGDKPYPYAEGYSVVPDHGLEEWVDPPSASYGGQYFGGVHVRVSGGRRSFLITLSQEIPEKCYNFQVVLKDGAWSHTLKKFPDIKIVAVSEIVEAVVPLFPATEEFNVWYRLPWANGEKK